MLAPDPRFERIDRMDGREFQAEVGDLLELLGFENVERIPAFDKGADIVAVRDGKRVAVQVKRWSTPINLSAVRQLVDGKARYGCEEAILVTNSYLNRHATECARFHRIEVWDRRTLANYTDGDEPTTDTSVCAECGASVSPGVSKWCLTQLARYGGFVYCPKHQARSQRRAG